MITVAVADPVDRPSSDGDAWRATTWDCPLVAALAQDPELAVAGVCDPQPSRSLRRTPADAISAG